MREILFKAKSVDTGEWVEGLYIRDISREKSERLSHFAHKIKPLYDQAYEEPINPETLCQYTGLTDKNGNKIWENDVVAFHHYEFGGFSGMNKFGFPILNQSKERVRNYAIEFVNTYCTYGLRFRNKSIHFPCKLSTLRMHDVEVIGNIFDNPELIGK